MAKSAEAFRTISEVADDLGIPKHVLRFWEVKFNQIRPMKRGGGRRYYRPADLELLKGIRHLLHREGYTIKGVQKILREHGVEAVKQHASTGPEIDRRPDAASAPLDLARQASATSGAVLQEPDPQRRPSVKASTMPTRKRSAEFDRVIALAIAELEACRQILRGASLAATSPTAKSAVGGDR